ncbi:MAG: sigma-54 dependent transcriptional regulator [bacterium]
MTGRILIVDDEKSMCEMLESDLLRRGFEPTALRSADEAFSALLKDEFDVVLADLNIPGMNGIELCERIAVNKPDVPVIVMTAFGSMDTAVAAIRAGAYDFVTKPVDLDILALALDRAVKHRELSEKVKVLTDAASIPWSAEGLVGDSHPMRELRDKITRIADTEASVLITGESGTGKELVARLLHEHSRRRAAPFVPVNCAAIPDTLLESELFGHRPGAFTDAKTGRKGLFLEADRGTLFLDEIGEIPMALQPKLLRALEERRIRPIGGNEELAVDVRVISATNRDLESATEHGRFREDLFYRLNVIQIEVPPLRARGSDALLLALHFAEKIAGRMKKNVIGISGPAAEKLLEYDWPGNVRELRNAIERAVALARFEEIIVDDLPDKIRAYQSSQVLIGSDNPSDLITLEDVERRYIRHVLKMTGGNKTLAARILGLDRKTLYRKLRRFGGKDTWDEH